MGWMVMKTFCKIWFGICIFVTMGIFGGAAQAANPDTCLGDGDGTADCRPPQASEFKYTWLPTAGLFGSWNQWNPAPTGCIVAVPQDNLEKAVQEGYGSNVACFGASICSASLESVEPALPLYASVFTDYPEQYETTVNFTTVESPTGVPQCKDTVNRKFQIRWERKVRCPSGYIGNNYTAPLNSYCYRPNFVQPPACRDSACPTPHPIDPISGAKLRVETDYVSASGLLKLVRYYHSYAYPRRGEAHFHPLGNHWQFGHESSLSVDSSKLHRMAYLDRQDGYTWIFQEFGGHWIPMLERQESLTFTPATAVLPAFWIFKTRANQMELYSETGRLLKTISHDGRQVSISYGQNGKILEISDDFKRKISANYDGESGVFKGFTDPEGNAFHYTIPEIGQGKQRVVTDVEYPDGARRRFAYGESGANETSLTSIYDENDKRYARFSYSSLGNAMDSELAGGVEKYYVWENSDVYPPSGNRVWYTTQKIANMLRPTHVQYTYEGYAKRLEYDISGNLTGQSDNIGKTCYAYDLSRNVETVRVEGVASNQACTLVTAANSTLPAGSRKISTYWHPDWQLPVRVAEPRRIITSVYNGQPDPTASGVKASCAPSDALLPDGKPIAVLCKRVLQSTSDFDGTAGFSAAVSASEPPQI